MTEAVSPPHSPVRSPADSPAPPFAARFVSSMRDVCTGAKHTLWLYGDGNDCTSHQSFVRSCLAGCRVGRGVKKNKTDLDSVETRCQDGGGTVFDGGETGLDGGETGLDNRETGLDVQARSFNGRETMRGHEWVLASESDQEWLDIPADDETSASR